MQDTKALIILINRITIYSIHMLADDRIAQSSKGIIFSNLNCQ